MAKTSRTLKVGFTAGVIAVTGFVGYGGHLPSVL